MPRVFADRDISRPDHQSYVDIVSNTGLIRTLNARRDVPKLITGRLPESALPLFLHEGTHHWCFHSPLGFALAALYYRGIAGLQSAAGQDSSKPSSGSPEARFLSDLLRFRTATKLLEPLMEGLALFCEFDCQVSDADILPVPLGLALTLFSRTNCSREGEESVGVKGMIERAHTSPEVIGRKKTVLLTEFSPARNPYLCGYLGVKRLHGSAARHHSAFNDPSTLLVFLRNFFFEDFVLVRILLDEAFSDSAFLTALFEYLAGRFEQLRPAEIYKKVPDYFSALEREVNSPTSGDEISLGLSPELSLTESEAAAKGVESLHRLVDGIRAMARAEGGNAGQWRWAWDGLASRHPFVLDVSDVFIRISATGICSVWHSAASARKVENAILLGAQSSNKTVWGKEGGGKAVILVSNSDAVAVAAFVLGEELVVDTLAGNPKGRSFDALREIACEVPSKMAVQNELDTILGSRLLEPAYLANFGQRAPAMVNAIYLSAALPWLSSAKQVSVMERLDGLGIGRLFPQKQRGYLIRMVVSWSLGAPAADEDIERYLATKSPDESLPDLIERTNQYARGIWGEGLIHMEAGGISSTCF